VPPAPEKRLTDLPAVHTTPVQYSQPINQPPPPAPENKKEWAMTPPRRPTPTPPRRPTDTDVGKSSGWQKPTSPPKADSRPTGLPPKPSGDSGPSKS
jgi:hypothetical protein